MVKQKHCLSRNKVAILNAFKNCGHNESERKSEKSDLDEALLMWFKQGMTENMPINGPKKKWQSYLATKF